MSTTRVSAVDSVDALTLREQIDTLAGDTDDSLLAMIEIRDPDTSATLLAAWRVGLKRLDHLWLDHHIEVVIDIPNPDERGLCDPEELAFLQDLEAELLEALDEQAVFIWSCCGERKTFHTFANDSDEPDD